MKVWGAVLLLAILVTGMAWAQDSLNVRRLGQLSYGGNARGIDVVDTLAYLATDETGIRVVNITTPSNPIEIGYYETPNQAYNVVVSADYAYIPEGWGDMRVLNISNPVSPFEVGYFDTPELALGVAVAESLACITAGWDGVFAIDISDPTNPIELNWYERYVDAMDVLVLGNYAYVIDLQGMYIVGISESDSLLDEGYCSIQGIPHSFDVSGGYAYLVYEFEDHGGMIIFDIANPASPIEICDYYMQRCANDITVYEDYAYLADGSNGLRVINVSNPAAPNETGFYNTPGNSYRVAVTGSYVYLADGDYFGIYDCTEATSVITKDPKCYPQTIRLHPSYPNPFNPTATIQFDLPVASEVSLAVFNVNGQLVETLANGQMLPGSHAVTFDGSRFSSGSYFYTLKTNDFVETRQMLLVK